MTIWARCQPYAHAQGEGQEGAAAVMVAGLTPSPWWPHHPPADHCRRELLQMTSQSYGWAEEHRLCKQGAGRW